MDMTTTYSRPIGKSLFEEELTLKYLSQMGNPLKRLSKLVDFEMFCSLLEDVTLTVFFVSKFYFPRMMLIISVTSVILTKPSLLMSPLMLPTLSERSMVMVATSESS